MVWRQTAKYLSPATNAPNSAASLNRVPFQPATSFAAKLILMLAGEASFNTIKRRLQARAPKIIRWKLSITPAQAQEIVFGHIQCISKNCPMLIFAEPLSRELKTFFGEDR